LENFEPPKLEGDEDAAIVVAARLIDPQTKKVLSRFATWPEPFKFLQFPKESDIDLKVSADASSGKITVSAQRPVKGLILYFDDEVSVDDNGLDVMPGDVQTVTAKGLKSTTKVSCRYLGDKYCP